MAMQTLSCPMPTNINLLSPNGFQFAITKLPNLSYFCQEVNLPDISLGEATQASPFSDISIPGDKLEFGQLTVQFGIDEDMSNYKGIHNWLTALGFPKDKKQYTSWMSENDTSNNTSNELMKNYSDATLGILNNNNSVVQTLQFRDLYPINLSAINFISTSTDVQYLIGSATFKYTYYEFID